MLEGTSMLYNDNNIVYSNATTGCINWTPLPPVAMELVLEKPSNRYDSRQHHGKPDKKRERVKDNDIVIPDELLEELSDLPPTPVAFNYNQLPVTPPFTTRGSYGFHSSPDSEVEWRHGKQKRHLPSIKGDTRTGELLHSHRDNRVDRAHKKQRLSYRPQLESEEDYYVKFQQRMADTSVGFVGGDVRRARKKASPNQDNLPVLHTESCTLHDKILAKYVRYKEEVHINNNNKPTYGELYAKRKPATMHYDPTDLQSDLQPTVMGLRRILGTNQYTDKYNNKQKYQHHLAPIRHKSKQTKGPYDETEIELFSSRSLRKTKGSILTSPRSNRLLGKTRHGYNASHVPDAFQFE